MSQNEKKAKKKVNKPSETVQAEQEIEEKASGDDITVNDDEPLLNETANEETADLSKEYLALQLENSELKEKILRLLAENQNTRRRLEKQKQDAIRYRHQDILSDLADVIDNFERAIDSSVESRDFDSFHTGIVMIEKQFSGMLSERYGLEKIGAPGEKFNPVSHEAVMLEETDEVEQDTVKEVFQTGYRLNDRVLRPAKVVVRRPVSEQDS